MASCGRVATTQTTEGKRSSGRESSDYLLAEKQTSKMRPISKDGETIRTREKSAVVLRVLRLVNIRILQCFTGMYEILN